MPPGLNVSPNFTTSQEVANDINLAGGGAVNLGTYYGTTPTAPVLGLALPSTSSTSPVTLIILGFLAFIGLIWAFKKKGA